MATTEPAAPAVSVVLPCRNCSPTLDACLDSILSQSLEQFEVVAVDDHSEDDTLQQLRARASGEPRIRPLCNPGKGLVSALNFGLQQSRAPLVARMDGDDLMHPERLAKQVAALRAHPTITVLGCQARLFPDALIGEGYREYMRWQNSCIRPEEIADDLYIESPLAHPTVLFRRDAVIGAGGYLEGPFPEDYELWLRLHHAGHRMLKLEEVLLDWRESPSRTSRTDPRYRREAFDRLRARYLAKDPRLTRRADDFVVWGAGRKTRKRVRHLLGYGYRPTAWIDIDPAKIGNRIAGIPVLDVDALSGEWRPFVLSYVTNHGARSEIAEALRRRHYRCGADYLMVG